MSKSKSGGSQSKFGRGSRSPSSKTYRLAQRWNTNKAKRIKRHTRHAAKHEIRKIERAPMEMRNHERLVQLRQIVSQNMTG